MPAGMTRSSSDGPLHAPPLWCTGRRRVGEQSAEIGETRSPDTRASQPVDDQAKAAGIEPVRTGPSANAAAPVRPESRTDAGDPKCARDGVAADAPIQAQPNTSDGDPGRAGPRRGGAAPGSAGFGAGVGGSWRAGPRGGDGLPELPGPSASGGGPVFDTSHRNRRSDAKPFANSCCHGRCIFAGGPACPTWDLLPEGWIPGGPPQAKRRASVYCSCRHVSWFGHYSVKSDACLHSRPLSRV